MASQDRWRSFFHTVSTHVLFSLCLNTSLLKSICYHDDRSAQQTRGVNSAPLPPASPVSVLRRLASWESFSITSFPMTCPPNPSQLFSVINLAHFVLSGWIDINWGVCSATYLYFDMKIIKPKMLHWIYIINVSICNNRLQNWLILSGDLEKIAEP